MIIMIIRYLIANKNVAFFLCPLLRSEQAPHEQEEDTTSGPVGPLPQSDELNTAVNPQDNNIVEVKVALQPKVSLMGRFHWFCLFEMSVESNSPNLPPSGPQTWKVQKAYREDPSDISLFEKEERDRRGCPQPQNHRGSFPVSWS